MNDGKYPLILMPEYSLYEDKGFHRGSEFDPVAKMIILDKNRRGGSDWFRGNTSEKQTDYFERVVLHPFYESGKEAFELFHKMQDGK